MRVRGISGQLWSPPPWPNKSVKTDYRGVPRDDPKPRRGSRLPLALCVARQGKQAPMKQAHFPRAKAAGRALAVGHRGRLSLVEDLASWQRGEHHCASSAARPRPQAQSVLAPTLALRDALLSARSSLPGHHAARGLSHRRCARARSHNQALKRTPVEFLAMIRTWRCGSRLAQRYAER